VTRAFIGLGSNVGRRLHFLRAAVRNLAGLSGTRLVKLSPVYETSAVGPRQRHFLNAVAEIRTNLGPQDLLRDLKALEERLGRCSRQRWGPREIDLDVLLYGRLRKKTVGLVLPHPRLWERRFALQPLADLAPRHKDPVTGRSVARRLRELTAPGQIVRLYRTAGVFRREIPKPRRRSAGSRGPART
jgi:2-amino-4-hydroxy-6-hydroxymethyldihydropteridine diphosphokinase